MILALVLQALFLGLAFGARTLIHRYRTGSTGFRALSQSSSLAARIAVVLLIGGGSLSLAGVVLSNVLETIWLLDNSPTGTAGIVAAAAGLIAVLIAQITMGASWRIGVDQSETTELVTTGLFAVVRNPIFSGMLLFWCGIGLMVPNLLCIAAPIVFLAGIEAQVRLVEEPYLLRTHGDAYRRYASRIGRLVPGLGKLRDSRSGSGAIG